MNQALSHPPTDSDFNDNVTAKLAGLSLSHPSDKVTASGNRPPTHEENIKALNRHCQELPNKRDRANHVPPADLVANSERLITDLGAIRESWATESKARVTAAFAELERRQILWLQSSPWARTFTGSALSERSSWRSVSLSRLEVNSCRAENGDERKR